MIQNVFDEEACRYAIHIGGVSLTRLAISGRSVADKRETFF